MAAAVPMNELLAAMPKPAHFGLKWYDIDTFNEHSYVPFSLERGEAQELGKQGGDLTNE